MSVLHYKGRRVACRPGETVLDALVRSGQPIDFSCRSGVCRRCQLKRTDAAAPAAAQRSLPAHLQAAGYLLACQCRPTEDMVLAPASPEDMLTACVLMQLTIAPDGSRQLAFEACTELHFQPGQTAQLNGPAQSDPVPAELIGHDDTQGWILARVAADDGSRAAWLADGESAFGVSFDLRGPFPLEPADEVVPLPPDPSLWAALDDGRLVRTVLERFYAAVYADPLLQPYFARVTMDRVIGKQYAFLRQSITGEATYIGERPHNVHHWMVIPDRVFEHRQQLMRQAQQALGLSEALIDRWTRYEEQYRPDIVKHAPWPRRIGDQRVETEGYDSLVLGEATVCDHCAQEIPAGTQVRYHLRLGQVGCHRCSPLPGTAEPS